MKLKITFSRTNGVKVNYALKKTVRDAILATLKQENFECDSSVSVTFTDNRYIREINREYRGVDKHTDVLSFPLYEAEELEELDFELGGAMLGDIVVSLERASEQAAELGNSFLREVAFLCIHSTLHLLGYDHERSKADDELQCERQREIISKLQILEEDK